MAARFLNTPDLSMRSRALRFREVLLQEALFDEAHWLQIAFESPVLCDGEYARTSLRAAERFARSRGLIVVASWIEAILSRPSQGRRLAEGHNFPIAV